MPNAPAPHVVEVWTEGKTDWQHLKTAMGRLGLSLPIVFREYTEPMGDDRLLKRCQEFAERQDATPVVFIFDRDKTEIVQRVNDKNNSYKSWGNAVYSFAIPEPSHRKGYSNICIEFFYSDEELRTKDKDGRRLFLTSEFQSRSGKHKEDKNLSVGNRSILQNTTGVKDAKIVDTEIFDATDANIALSKAEFANAIFLGNEPFDCIDFSEFRLIFDILADIVKATRPTNTVYLPDLDSLFASIENFSASDQLYVLYHLILGISTLSLQVFAICTIRVYEDAFIHNEPQSTKKLKDIQRILRDSFYSPSLITLRNLAEKCYHLVKDSAPAPLVSMKACLHETFVLGPLGQVLEDLENIYPPKPGTSRALFKSRRRDDLLDFHYRTLFNWVFQARTGCINLH